MEGSSNQLDASARIQDLKYLYASIANLSNFVSVKLSSDRNYHLWKTQMLCLMKSHNMAGIVDDAYKSPGASSEDEIMDQYDSLLKGWIFGSVSENVLGAIVDLASAKDAWDKLKSFYDVTVTVSHQQGGTEAEAKAEAETNTETKDVNEISAQTSTNGRDTVIDMVSNKTETEGEDPDNKAAGNDKTETKKNLREATMKGDWTRADSILKKDKDLVREAISSDGSTILHIAVGIGNKDFVKNLFSYITEEDVLATRSSDGSTALHIAAIVGNTYAAELLLKKNKECLRIEDGNRDEPLQKAYENMHLDTIGYLLKAIEDDRKKEDSVHPGDEMGVNLLVNAISAKQYNLASDLIEKFPQFASKNDNVLMAIAKTFPSGDYGETIIPLSWKDLWENICSIAEFFMGLHCLRFFLFSYVRNEPPSWRIVSDGFSFLLFDVFLFLYGVILLHRDVLLYLLTWMTISLVEPITHTEKKKKDMDEAEKVLKMICDQIDKLKFTGYDHHPYYTGPILEAACQNAHKVVDEILCRSPKVIQSTDKSGLAPSGKLNKRRGAALQLQRELQWREEVKKVVFPTYITRDNIFLETPAMVFTREHENLVKDGEQWLKTTAESCSISAGLIITIVFAAAITVPGGSNQDTGIPLFTQDIAFSVFAVSDAISFFASSTALLMFLSILTSRFAEKDFLRSLPKRLLIGICALLLSAISMMIAFSATLFIVFGHQKPWLLVPICGSSLIPISFFVVLPLPLIKDLFRSTYISEFGPRRRGKRARFNPDNIRLSFGK
ncbi:ankyrin repeat-containing domain, PGG domain, Gag-polypeptide of LTR copia-type [Artemisia annua]|uniref:Ankyrin repeat-containing domain, PGG domain, Gag-polypeptide of LTR copia-type n=1 Tax=Artemisia annua TaxID=35608 RepID=A0A2U1NN56_ARTAN|nr:ankyrin repeat-containing domain, PGG domain, Gag-polypeptide of LTR copia-type [Artemisia annua]